MRWFGFEKISEKSEKSPFSREIYGLISVKIALKGYPSTMVIFAIFGVFLEYFGKIFRKNLRKKNFFEKKKISSFINKIH